MNEVQKRLTQFIKYLNISISQFEQRTGVANGFVSSTNARMRNSTKNLISSQYPELNMDWLIRGRGEMLNTDKNTINSYGANSANAIHGNAVVVNNADPFQHKKIPFYEKEGNEKTTNIYNHTAYISTGDLFKNATSLIRHYGSSMIEYPNGSILALRRMKDISLLNWGNNYCIETSEFKITRRIQDGGENYILAYSSNTKTYPDGTLIHSPIRIPKSSILHIDLVLGCIIKEYSNDLM